MPKAIKFIQSFPKTEHEKRSDIKIFVKAMEFALGFAPDRSHGVAFRLLGSEATSILHITSEIQAALENSFFEELFVDRPEREQVESDLPGQRLVLVNGLVGTGKTVLLMKVSDDMSRLGAKFAYFDLKAKTELLGSGSPEKIPDKLRNMVYIALKAQYIDQVGLTASWDQYRVQNDSSLIGFRQILHDIYLESVLSDEKMNNLLDHPSVKERLDNFVPSLQLLIEFLSKTAPVILCFDNVDRYSIDVQRYVLETCIDLSNDAEIPVILAIREANLRRMTPSGALGDITFIEKMKGRSPKHISVRDFRSLNSSAEERPYGDISTEELLSKRLDFVHYHWEFAPLQNYFKSLNDKYEFGISIIEYRRRFWEVFKIISQTFVDGHVYSYCNYSIRKILVMYFGFIDKLLLDPDPGYTIESILTEKKHVRVTKLRNYFYKWLICSDEPVPPDKRNLVNIFDSSRSNQKILYNFIYKILSYLYNRKAFDSASSVTLKEVVDDFKVFGIQESQVKDYLLRLTNDQDFEEETLIWREISNSVDEQVFISFILMPAGKYFVEKLSISREYAFWNALDTDLSNESLAQLVKTKQISYLDTFSDQFKLDLVHDFVKLILYPQLLKELQSLAANPTMLGTRDSIKIRRYWKLFGIKGHSYEVNLLNSVKETINHASIYQTKYRDLITLLKASEHTYGLYEW